ncbi:MAG: ABC transporter permease [Cytophagaceae bacterium]|nr:ABC transporter permease [Cytophagaceae bacterium]
MKPTVPPRWAERLLTWFCAPHLLEEVQGDLHERFQRRVALAGERVARRQYAVEVLGFLRLFALKRRPDELFKPISINSLMLRNYFKIAGRNLIRHRAFSVLNIAGLALGMATSLIILLFVQDELSYDRFNEKADRIVRIVFKANINGGKINEAFVMPPTAQVLRNDYPEVQQATRLRNFGTPRVAVGNQFFVGDKLAYVDANFFEVFTIPFLKGNPKTALIQPNCVVISSELAQRYFGTENPIGNVLYFKKGSDKLPFRVTGVFDKIPSNAHFHFDLFGSMASDTEAASTSWLTSNYFTYLVLPEGYDYKQLEAKLPNMVETHMGPQILQAMGMSLAQFRTKGNQLGFQLQRLTDIHFNSNGSNELEAGSDLKYVYIFSAIAVFMLLIACINFINLSTAGASKRAREVGVRKVLGSAKLELVGQFLVESLLLTSIALVLTVGLLPLALPIFNDLAGKQLSLGLTTNPLILPGLLGVGLVVGLLAGIYPAFFLSSFKPVVVLKGRFAGSRNGFGLRSGLVIFQFSISICLIVGTITVYRQLAYIQHKKLGYDKEQLLVLENSWALGKNEAVLREQLLNDARVVNVTTSPYKPAGPTDSNNSLAYPEGNDAQLMRTLQYGIDDRYIPTMGMEMAAGRNFSEKLTTDSSGIIINEAAANAFGWGKNAVGHNVTRVVDNDGTKKVYRVIGVVKDFHFKSLHESITPLLMVYERNWGLIVKVKTTDMAGFLASLKTQWTQFGVEEPFTYAFMDELVDKTYQSEQKVGVILNSFALLTIFIACLGLFGLATFTAEQRTKEIGVRKVLGASVASIVGLLSKDFLKLVLVAMVLAAPIAWYAMNQWLQDFAYKIDLEWWVFALAGLLALLIALLTVSFQAIKAALMNPVKSLRSE